MPWTPTRAIDDPRARALCELAHDGVWTRAQLHARLAAWGTSCSPRHLVTETARLRATARARTRTSVEVVRPTAAALDVARIYGVDVATVRGDELEHALGLAELRFRAGIPVWESISGARIIREQRHALAAGIGGTFRAAPDGASQGPSGLVLYEYDTGSYTARQVRAKLAAARAVGRVHGHAVAGHVWGAPTEARARWLHAHGVAAVHVVDPAAWLGAGRFDSAVHTED